MPYKRDYKSIYDFDALANEIDKMPYKPTWDYPADGTIYDEDQTVRWNREKVKENQAKWEEEKAQLKDAKSIRWEVFRRDLIHFIMDEIDVSEKVAEKIWEIADWDFNKCECLMDDYYTLREIERGESE